MSATAQPESGGPEAGRVVDDLPKGPTGKINKAALREKLWAGRERRV